MKSKSHFLAEVIECSLARFTAQCWQREYIPSYGSLVAVDGKEGPIFGLVQHIYTASDDPIRHVGAYQKTEEELLRDQPQIFAFIKTFFQVLIIGYVEKEHLFYEFAPIPVALHSFVRRATDEEYRYFFSHHYYLNLIFSQVHLIDNVDELLLGLIKSFREKGVFESVIEAFVEQYSLLNSADYRRLKFFMERIEAGY